MKQTIQCCCGFDVPFEEYDRGFEVYCPSCGQACAVSTDETGTAEDETREDEAPTTAQAEEALSVAPEVAPDDDGGTDTAVADAAVSESATARRSVFSSRFGDQLMEREVTEVACLCGETISVRLDEMGYSVYCPKCGAEVQTGASLGTQAAQRATAEPTDVPAPQPRFRLVRSPFGSFVTLCILVSMVFGAYLTWEKREEVVEFFGITIRRPPPRIGEPGEEIPFEPDAVTPEAIDALMKEEDPFAALAKAWGWRKGLRDHQVTEDDPRFAGLDSTASRILTASKDRMLEMITALPEAENAEEAFERLLTWSRVLTVFEVPVDDPRVVALAEVEVDLIERADPITLKMIAALLEEQDAADALVQAQMWQEDLHDRRAPESDPRWGKLEQVVAELRNRLVPKETGPPPYVVEFKDAVQGMADHLREKDAKGARKAHDRAEELFNEHPDELAPYSRRFVSLRTRLIELELLTGGVDKIEELLGNAERAVRSGDTDQVTAALESKARAVYLATISPMSPIDADRLKEQLEKLAPDLRFLRGKRAVADAKRCRSAGDKVAQYRSVLAAKTNLYGLSDRKVAPFAKDLQELESELKPPPKRGEQPSSRAGRDVVARDLYEEVLDRCSRGNVQELVSAAVAADKVLREFGDGRDNRSVSSEEVLLDVLEARIGSLTGQLQRKSKAEKLTDMLSVRRALDQAEPWKASHRWKALDGALRDQGKQLAASSFEDAVALAEKNELEQAVEQIVSAIELGDSETAGKAKYLLEQWQAELAIRADKKAAAEQMSRIEALVNEDKDTIAWYELREYLERYPQGEAIEHARELQRAIESRARQAFAQRVGQVESLVRKRKWSAAMWRLTMLEAIADTPERRSQISSLRRARKEKAQEIKTEYSILRKKIQNHGDAIEVQRVAKLMLAVEPDHVEARQLLEEARNKGAKWAEAVLRKARYAKNNPDRYRKKLELAYRLDPGGEQGKKARALLAKLE